MLPKIISFVLTILFINLCGGAVLADPIEPPNVSSEKFTFLQSGMVAPFDGILLMPEAMSKILADSEFALKQMELEHKYKTMEFEAMCSMEKDKLHVSLDIEKRLCSDRLALKEEKYDKLLDVAQEGGVDTLERVLWGGGGLIVGILVTAGTTYIILETTK